MNIVDELSRLAELHDTGAITDEEFDKAKEKLLDNVNPDIDKDSVASLKHQVNILSLEKEIDHIDRQWEEERKQYLQDSKYGHPIIPTKGSAIMASIGMIILALLWIFVTLVNSNIFMAFIGFFLLMFGIGYGISQHDKAQTYDDAYAAYQERRNEQIEKIAQVKNKPHR